jgi:hypothetical protein
MKLGESNLQPFTRVRVTRCWDLMALMPGFAVLYSLRCRGLLDCLAEPPAPLSSIERKD